MGRGIRGGLEFLRLHRGFQIPFAGGEGVEEARVGALEGG